jgi:hypothetical protein
VLHLLLQQLQQPVLPLHLLLQDLSLLLGHCCRCSWCQQLVGHLPHQGMQLPTLLLSVLDCLCWGPAYLLPNPLAEMQNREGIRFRVSWREGLGAGVCFLLLQWQYQCCSPLWPEQNTLPAGIAPT